MDFDFLIGTQSDPNVVGQLIAYCMIRQTPSWPPESLGACVQLGETMNQVLGKITPSIPVFEFAEDVDGEEEEGI